MAEAAESSVAFYNDLLKSFWDRGLRGTSTAEEKMLAAELSSETGLTLVQIQVHF
jgi:hypothetical protein